MFVATGELRGRRRKLLGWVPDAQYVSAEVVVLLPKQSLPRTRFAQRWAELTYRIHRVDPLTLSSVRGAQVKTLAFITEHTVV
jgi:hypothetical protein